MRKLPHFFGALCLMVTHLHAQHTKPTSTKHPKGAHAFSKTDPAFLPEQTLIYDWDFFLMDWTEKPDTFLYQYAKDGTVRSQTLFSDYFLNTQQLFKYNAAKQLIETIELLWLSDSLGWGSTYRNLRKYDSLNQPIANLYFEYNNGWNPSFGYQYLNTYDSQNRLTSVQELEWDADMYAYLNHTKRLYAYNAAGQPTEEMILNWNDSLSQFDTMMKNSNMVWHTWSGNFEQSFLSSSETLVWNGSSFVPNSRYSHTYDAHNNPTGLTHHWFDGVNWETYFQTKSENTYNTNDVLTQSVFSEWDGSSFKPSQKNCVL